MTASPEDARNAILQAALRAAAFDGWTETMLAKAAVDAGLPEGADALYFPDGPVEVITHWAQTMDTATRDAVEALDLEAMKIRERVTEGVAIRLSQFGRHEEAARRAQARLSLPDAVATAAKLTWAAADTIWTAIGDTSTDANYYSKRAVLSAVIATTAPVWINDALPNKPDGRAFLDRRINDVMQFEKLKASVRGITGDLPNPAEVLGKVRYGALRQKGVPTRREKRRIRRRSL